MTILLIDDELELREILKESLEHKGYTILEASNGSEGLQILDGYQVSCVICDVIMPVMDGVDFLKAAKARNQHLPVYMMTGYSRYSSKSMKDLGASGYFEKSATLVDQIYAQFQGIAS